MVDARKPAGSRQRSRRSRPAGHPPAHLITALGQTLTYQQWEKRTGINGGTIRYRLHSGWLPDEAVTVPTHVHNRRVATPEGYRFNLDQHEDFGSKEHRSWSHMLGRCNDPDDKSYHRYGERGIKVCERWTGPGAYARFLEDMGRAPQPHLTLERVDNSKGYEPGNVVWATKTAQARNRRSARLVTAFGETKCLAEWAESSDLRYCTIQARLDHGWNPEWALTAPLHSRKQ